MRAMFKECLAPPMLALAFDDLIPNELNSPETVSNITSPTDTVAAMKNLIGDSAEPEVRKWAGDGSMRRRLDVRKWVVRTMGERECLGVHLLSMKSQIYHWPGDAGHVADEAVSSSQHQPSRECRVIFSTSALVPLVISHPFQSFLFCRITHSPHLLTFYHRSGLLLQSLDSVSRSEVRRKRREIVKKKQCLARPDLVDPNYAAKRARKLWG